VSTSRATGFRWERLLPIACLASAGVLFASELMTTFNLTPIGVDPQCAQSAIDRHHYAPIVLAVFAVIALAIAVLSASKPAAIAVAICGVLALAIFLVIDLPDANNVGTIDDSCGSFEQSFIDAKAEPESGFWLELVGSLALAISGLALASLSTEQLKGIRSQRRRPRKGPGRESDRDAPGTGGSDLLADAERYGEEVSPSPPSSSGNSNPQKAPAKERPT
jgi:hypothetical protein